MLRAYPVSKQWFRMLAERLGAIAVLYHVAAMVADADPHSDHVCQGRRENVPAGRSNGSGLTPKVLHWILRMVWAFSTIGIASIS